MEIKPVRILKNMHRDKAGVIIGCGESNYKIEFNKIVICINDSIRKYFDYADFWITQHLFHFRNIGFIEMSKTKIIIPELIDGGIYSSSNYLILLKGYDCYKFMINNFDIEREKVVEFLPDLFLGHTTFHFAISLSNLLGLKSVELIGFNKEKRLDEGDYYLKENKIDFNKYKEFNKEGEELLEYFKIKYEYK